MSEWADKYPDIKDSRESKTKEPGDEPQVAEDKTTYQEGGELMAVVMRLDGIETPIALIFNNAVAEEIREAHPDAALWSEDAFRRFMDDSKRMSLATRRKSLAGLCLVKTTMGGTYQGIEVTKGGIE